MASAQIRLAALGTAAFLLLANPVAALAAEATTPAQPAPAPTTTAPAPPGSEAAPLLSEDEALALLKRYFKIPDGPGRLEFRLDSADDRQVWYITHWIDHGNGSTGMSIGSVDARSGQILDFDMSGRWMQTPRTGPLGQPRSEEEAQKRAWELVQKLYPEHASSLRPSTDAFSWYPYFNEFDTYSFSWVTHHNGVPVPYSMVQVTLDRYSLDYLSVRNMLKADLSYATGAAAVTPEQALAKLREAAVPELRYQPIYPSSPFDYDEAPEYKLLYQVVVPAHVDALTGEFPDFWSDQTASPQVIAAGTSPLSLPALPLTKEGARAYARQVLELPAGADIEVTENPDGTQFSLYFAGGDYPASVTLDAKTGMVDYAYRYVPVDFEAEAPEPTPEQKQRAEQAAIKVVQQLFGRLLPDLRLESQPLPNFYPGQSLSFRFQRYVHGIPFGFDGISVEIDPQTGKWTNISRGWQAEVKATEPAGAVSPERAVEAFFSGRTAQLSYGAGNLFAMPVEPFEQAPSELRLVYQLSHPERELSYGIDAFTGRPHLAADDSVDLQAIDRILTNHPAEGELRYLLNQRLIDPAKLDPAGTVTREESLRILLTILREMESFPVMEGVEIPFSDVPENGPLAEWVREAVARGILIAEEDGDATGAEPKPFANPKGEMLRAELVTTIVRSLKMGELARSPLQTISGFRDLEGLTREEQNSAAFLEALGILPSGDSLRGREPVTQADAATWLVRLLVHLHANL